MNVRMAVLSSLLVLVTGALAVAAPPAVFWASDPVLPGEVALVEGGAFGAQPRVELTWLRDGAPGQPAPGTSQPQKTASVVPLQAADESVKFLIPASWKPGLYSFQVDAAGVKSQPVVLNAPDPWWQQGDWGQEASPGGWLRVLGKCLSFGSGATVALRRDATVVSLKPRQQEQWSLTADLPTRLQPGRYQVWVHNGLGGAAGWREVGPVEIKAHPPLWQSDTFDVRDYGAVPNDVFEDTAAIQAALDAAERNGGGIVSLPRGRFQINNTLRMPRLVLLRGQGADLTQLYWRDRVQPLDVLIQGTNSFGVEDLSVTAFNHIGGIAADGGDKPGAGNVFLRRLVIRLNRFEQVQADEAGRRLLPMGGQGTHGPHAVSGGGENFQLTDCEIFSSRSPFGFTQLRHALIRNNRCFQGDTAHGLGGRYVIFEDNVVEGGPVARGGYEYVEDCLYFARNRIGDMHLADSELFTTDGGNTVTAKFVSLDGARATLAEDVNWNTWTRNGSRGVALFITHGTGEGQLRHITSFEGRNVVMDRPWTIAPDDKSTVILCPYFTHGLLIGNYFHDGAIVQDYCWGMDWVMAANKVARGGGIANAGRGKIPNWFVQYFDNEITVGSGTRGPWNDQPPTDSHLQVIGDGARAAVFRRNLLHNNARINVTQSVHDVVLDANSIRNADVGLAVEPRAVGVVLWNNRFEKVLQPLSVSGDQVFLHPVERLQNRLAADAAVPAALRSSSAWKTALDRLAKLRALDPADPALAQQVNACQAEFARAAATALPTGQPLDLLQVLTGLDLYDAAPAALQRLLISGSGGPAETSLVGSLPPWSLPFTLTVTFPPLPGWTITNPPPLALKPGAGATGKPQLVIPAGVWGKPTVPITYTAQGQGWTLHGTGRLQLASRATTDFLGQWMVVGPFQSSRPGELGETVYPPERRLDLAAEYPGIGGKVQWQPVQLATAPFNVDFTKLYPTPEKGVAYGVAVLRATRPTTVAITTNGGSTYAFGITYLNGERIGIPDRYGARKVSRTLQVGDNVLLCGMAQAGKTWQLNVQVEVAESAAPGDVRVLSVEEFAGVSAVKPPSLAAIPQGPSLPFSDGYDWRLVYEDDFNRDRLGPEWVAYEPQAWYEGNSWHLSGGHLASRASSYFEYLTYAAPLQAPVRVECDLTGAPDREPASLVGFTLTPRNQVGGRRLWGDIAGAGYMLTVGWNPPASHHLWRREKELQVNPNGPFLEAGKTSHVIAQFSPKRLLLVVDGKVSLDCKDPDWIPDLDTFSLMNGFGREWIDNVRIYSVAP